MRAYQVLPLRVRVDLGAMAMKEFPKAQALLASQIVLSNIQDTPEGNTPLQRCIWHIRQPQSIGLYIYIYIYSKLHSQPH